MAINNLSIDRVNIKGANELITNTDDKVLQHIYGTLTEVTGDFSALSRVPDKAFTMQPLLSKVEMLNMSGTIGTLAFAECKTLKTANIPMATGIYTAAFRNCTMLESVDIHNVIRSGSKADMSDDIFAGCENLKSIDITGFSALKGTFAGCKKLSSITCPNIVAIGGNTFAGCENLERVDMPNLQSIYYDGFRSFTGLKEFTNENENLQLGHTAIFKDCTNLETVSLLTSSVIAGEMFANCVNLKSVYLPNMNFRTDAAASGAFRNCVSLESIDLPSATTIHAEAFLGCHNLKSINMPNLAGFGGSCFSGCDISYLSLPKVVTLGNYALWSCENLRKVILPVCTSVGAYGFMGCKTLSVVVLGGDSVIKFTSSMFGQTPMESTRFLGIYGSIYVPASLVDAYKSQSYYGSRVVSIDDIPEGVLDE